MIDGQEIERVAALLGRAANAERVVLFGSHARGDAGENSDVDFMIIADSQLPRFKRSRQLYKLIRPHPFAMDLLVYTPEEVEKGSKSPVSFVSMVVKEGKTVYVRRDRSSAALAGQGQE